MSKRENGAQELFLPVENLVRENTKLYEVLQSE